MSHRTEVIAAAGGIVGIALGMAVMVYALRPYWESQMQAGSSMYDAALVDQVAADDQAAIADTEVRYSIDPGQRIAIATNLNRLLSAAATK